MGCRSLIHLLDTRKCSEALITKILIIANGEGKADIVRDAFFGPITPRVPASVLQLHNDVTLVADEAALSKIPVSFV